ncbi:MAG: PAS domain S-box protein [Flavobacteriales bacterium]|nr:PAS domain S-box protein [Flavobacteriales bacterium]MCB9447957.1 PAS domain S-box protein [Flavobacteriales bacterium]
MTPLTITQKEFKDIQRVVMAYSMGDYSERMEVGDKQGEKETVRAAINMLGEELEATTVGRDYLASIYNALPDIIIIASEDGDIKDVNAAVERHLGYDTLEITGQPVGYLFHEESSNQLFDTAKEYLQKHEVYTTELTIRKASRGELPILLSCSKIYDRYARSKGYLFVARDITDQKQTERLIVQTIIQTQEKEQKRVAEDLHDSLGQELAGLKLFLNTISESPDGISDENREVIDATRKILDGAISNLRNICFNLMPKSLAYDGLSSALEELFHRLNQQKKMRFVLQTEPMPEGIAKAVELLMFRVVQEFINNSIKHAEATRLTLKLNCDDTRLKLSIRDNGKGFDVEKLRKTSGGRGLTNMESRIKAFNGKLIMKSEPGSGTSLFISFLLDDICQ